MTGYTQLSVAGLPQVAAFAVIAAIGSSSGAASATAVGSDGATVVEGVGYAPSIATVFAFARSTHAASGLSEGRVAVSSAASIWTYAAAGTSAAQAQAFGYSSAEWSTLGVSGWPAPWYEIQNKTAITSRIWTIQDTLNVSIEFSDFTDREFTFGDVLGVSIVDTLSFSGSTGYATASAEAVAVGATVAETAGASSGVATVTGAGANLVVNEGAGSSDSAATVAGQGATAGTVFGVGVGQSGGTAAVAGFLLGTATTVGSATGVATAAAVSVGFFAGVGSADGSAAVYGSAAEEGVASSAGVATAAATATSTHEAAGSSTGVATVTGRIDAEGLGDIQEILFTARQNFIQTVGKQWTIEVKAA